MSVAISPLAPTHVPDLPEIGGVRLATAEAGIRYAGRTDVLLVMFDAGTTAAGVFTRSKCPSAPVEWCRAHLKKSKTRGLVVNSGNANAFTGKSGRDACRSTAEIAARAIGCKPADIFLASTGVIGEPLNAAAFDGVMQGLVERAEAGEFAAAARAIMTTDTFPKVATANAKIGKSTVTINGIAKGSGMIAPDMATMLSFVFTDANLPASVLQELLNAGVKTSFNAITVDSDTSTSDTLILFATGKGASHPVIAKANDKRLTEFRRKLDDVLLDLALQVVRDGEGAQKLIRIDVTGAENDAAAHRIGMSIANSPLVKTAIAGADANWGRIVMAVGKSGEKADRDKLRISIGGVKITDGGQVVPNYDEAPVTKHIKGTDIVIDIDLGIGRGRATVWTCDLTHGYIDINGSYRS